MSSRRADCTNMHELYGADLADAAIADLERKSFKAARRLTASRFLRTCFMPRVRGLAVFLLGRKCSITAQGAAMAIVVAKKRGPALCRDEIARTRA